MPGREERRGGRAERERKKGGGWRVARATVAGFSVSLHLSLKLTGEDKTYRNRPTLVLAEK